jgi:serine/threonine protein phosphatase PrpC
MKNGESASFLDNRAHGDDALLSREFSETSCLDIVLDGVSMGEGKVASAFAVGELGGISGNDEVLPCLKAINGELRKMKRSRAEDGRMITPSSTVTACLKDGDRLRVINMGDSPAYLLRHNVLRLLTTSDEHPLGPPAITNALGFWKKFRCHEKEYRLKDGDRLILMTDGISDVLTKRELSFLLKLSATAENARKSLERLLKIKKEQNLGRDRHYPYPEFKEDDRSAIIRFL